MVVLIVGIYRIAYGSMDRDVRLRLRMRCRKRSTSRGRLHIEVLDLGVGFTPVDRVNRGRNQGVRIIEERDAANRPGRWRVAAFAYRLQRAGFPRRRIGRRNLPPDVEGSRGGKAVG